MALFARRKARGIQKNKKESFDGWKKCSSCRGSFHLSEFQKNLYCCPSCQSHRPLPARERIQQLVDEGSFSEFYSQIQSCDPLSFCDSKTYVQRLEIAREKASPSGAIIVGKAKIEGKTLALAVMDFFFMAGSMGSVVGEKLSRLIEYATAEDLPLVIVNSSGGARMQESTISLMQMAKVSAALGRLHQKKLPYISVLTDPTTGGVTASFASLGDIILAEPKALICFAGPRVIEQTIQEKLPVGAQRSEFLLKHGMIDEIVSRADMQKKLASILRFFAKTQSPKEIENV